MEGGADPATEVDPEAHARLVERSLGYKQVSLAGSTKEAYTRDFRHFATWCESRGYQALPAEPVTVDLYLTDHAESYAPATLARRLVGINRAHKAAGYPNPGAAAAVRATFQGICRDQGTAQRQKAPVLTEDLAQLVKARNDGSLRGLRDQAVLLIGWAGALRASEIVALTVSDITPTSDGLIINIRKSKTDQAGAGQRIGVPTGATEETCPVRLLRAWLKASGITRGALFREVDRHKNVVKSLSRQAVTGIVKEAATAAGLEADLYSAHSLRAGLATSAAIGGADNRSIKKQGRWKSDRVMERYVRDAELFRDNAAKKAGI